MSRVRYSTILIAVFVLTLGASVPASNDARDVLRQGLLADAAVLRSEYDALHPGLYRYNSAEQMQRHYQRLEGELSRAPDLRAAFLAFSRFTASIRCGHSYPNFYNQPPDVARVLFGGRNRVPFYFAWLDRHMIVTKNLSGDARLGPGTEIESIDGATATQVLDALLPFVRADGSNDAKRVSELEVRGDERFEAFDIFFPLIFPKDSTTLDLRVREMNGAEAAFSVPALSDADRADAVAASKTAKDGDRPLWFLRFPSPNVAVLTMPTWAVYDTKWAWKDFLSDTFDRIAAQHADRLIIDLRGNEGGSDVGDVLLSHLIDAPLDTTAMRRLVRFRTVPPELLQHLTTWDPSFKALGADATVYDDRFFQLPDALGERSIAPQLPHFAGRVEVLVDAANSSATFNFESAVRRAHLATLIGEPTGGNQRGINGGAFFFIQLPNSHLEVDLPLIGTFGSEPLPDSGLVPDIVVGRTREDIARGIDSGLAAALATGS